MIPLDFLVALAPTLVLVCFWFVEE